MHPGIHRCVEAAKFANRHRTGLDGVPTPERPLDLLHGSSLPTASDIAVSVRIRTPQRRVAYETAHSPQIGAISWTPSCSSAVTRDRFPFAIPHRCGGPTPELRV